MASANEFFKSPLWDASVAAEFEARIRRVPKGRRLVRYSHKAWALFYRSGDDRSRQRMAISLIERGVSEVDPVAYADPSSVVAGEVAHELLTAAQYAVALGDSAMAIDLARRSIAVSARPFFSGLVSAQELLARCLTDAGAPDARAAWDEFYGHRERVTEGRWHLPAYDELAAREVVDTTGAPIRDPEQAAEGICTIYHAAEPPEPAVPGIMDPNVAALAALDHHYRVTKSSWERKWAPRAVFKESYLLGTHLPQLGAYVGRVLVHTMGGRWQVNAPLMRSRVLVGGDAIDPFRAAYDVIYFETSLVEFVRACGAT